jgi:hypothetical protein
MKCVKKYMVMALVSMGLFMAPRVKAAAQNLNTGTGEASIIFGQTQSGTLEEGEKNNYSFAAAAGDRVMVRLSRTSGLLDYTIELNGPDGQKLGEASSEATTDLVSEALQNPGTYSIRVSYKSGAGQGSYNLTLERLNPGSGASISFGHTVSGTLAIGDLNSYTFSATSGNRVIIRMSKTSGSLNPGIHLYSPDGRELKESWSARTAELTSDALPTTGIYTVLVADYWGTSQGEFNLVVERLNPGSGPVIEFGQRVSGILAAGDLNAFTFAAAAGDRVVLRMGQTSTSATLYPEMRLYDPAGTKIQEEWSSSELEMRTDTLPSAGTYTILVFDFFGIYAGEYQLILDRLNQPIDASHK